MAEQWGERFARLDLHLEGVAAEARNQHSQRAQTTGAESLDKPVPHYQILGVAVEAIDLRIAPVVAQAVLVLAVHPRQQGPEQWHWGAITTEHIPLRAVGAVVRRRSRPP